MLEYAIAKGVVSGRAAVARGKLQIYIDVVLTVKGEAYLQRAKHPFWFLGAIYDQVREFAAMVVGNIIKP
jgi:hypothetical protein